MGTEPAAYGLWPLVVINTLVFVIFAFSFSHPHAADAAGRPEGACPIFSQDSVCA
jgi:hypothetical protein